jgi:hypothetical protein
MPQVIHIFGDVHEYVENAQYLLKKHSVERAIWLGDFFDRKRRDGLEDGDGGLRRACAFLNDIAENRPEDIVLAGNHDIPYLSGYKKYFRYGCDPWRYATFNSEISAAAKRNFRIFHKINWNGRTVVFSHAGFDDRFSANFGGWKDPEAVERYVRSSCQLLRRSDADNDLFDSEFGPQWIRWNALTLSKEISNIVGHTPQKEAQILQQSQGKRNFNICIDVLWRGQFLEITENAIYLIDDKEDTRTMLVGVEMVGRKKKRVVNFDE